LNLKAGETLSRMRQLRSGRWISQFDRFGSCPCFPYQPGPGASLLDRVAVDGPAFLDLL